MKRRDFISTSGKALALTTLATGIGGVHVNALASSRSLSMLNQLAGDSDRVFVIVQLVGGNDGLNTVVPVDNPLYYNNRPNIAIPKTQALKIRDGLGWHPAMTGFRDLFNDGRLSVVQNVTYPNPDRSHFRGTDIWLTATDADVFKDTGWMGRYLQTLAPDFPEQMPAEPLAVQIGTTLSLGFKSDKGSLGITFRDPDAFYSLVDQNGSNDYDTAPQTLGGDELEFVRSVERASRIYSKAVKAAADKVKTNKVTYPNNNPLAQSLKIVARLIAGGLQTKLYLVNITGTSFDTHYDQGGATGVHATLLSYLSDGIKLFLDDCEQLGTGERVAGITFSEFGRRVMENGSRGTDHGTAAPLFVFGKNSLGGKVHGNDPNLTNLDNRGDLLMEFDYRQIYTASLLQWFGAPQNTVQSIMYKDFTALPLFKQAQGSVSVQDEQSELLLNSMANYPNPADEATLISYFLPQSSDVSVSVHDIRGNLVGVVFSGVQDAGVQRVTARTAHLSAGTYFYKVRAGRMEQMKALQIVR